MFVRTRIGDKPRGRSRKEVSFVSARDEAIAYAWRRCSRSVCSFSRQVEMGHDFSHLYYRVRASREVDGALSSATTVREALEPVAADSGHAVDTAGQVQTHTT